MILLLAISACDFLDGDTDGPTPTPADVESLITADFMATNAPPEGFGIVAYPAVDADLDKVVYAHALINFTFDGSPSEDSTGQTSNTNMRMEIWKNEFNEARQVSISFSGNAALLAGGSGNLDAVRLGNNYYMINPNGVCVTGEEDEDVIQIANLTAGEVIGGFEAASFTGQRETINGYEAWQYGFTPDDLVLPRINTTLNERSVVEILRGEVWVAPEYGIVVRYVVEMNVHQVGLLFSNTPVTGRLRYQYDVFDIGVVPNISIPNGC
jgi:hypothetical protein